MSDVVTPLLDWIGGLPLWALALAVVVALACESSLLVGLVVPGDLIVLLAASGVTSVPRLVLLAACAAAGSLAGETLGYLAGRRWGGRIRASRLGRALGEERWRRAGGLAERHGGVAVLAARYAAALHAVLPVMAGTLRMPPGRFLRWSAAGAVSWAAVYVALGAAAGASVRTAGERLDQAVVAVLAALAAAALVMWWRAWRRRPEAGATPDVPAPGGEDSRSGAAPTGRRQETGQGRAGRESRAA